MARACRSCCFWWDLGRSCTFCPAGIIPGTLFGAGVGGLANFTGALIGGTDPGSALLWGAAGGFIGGGISGGLQAHALGRNILTGAAPKPIPVPVPLSTPINPGEIRGVGQTAGQELVDATVESPVLGKSWPWRPASELSDIERVQSMLSRTFDPQEAAMLRNHFPYKEGLVPHNSLLKSVDAGGTGRIVTGANATHYRFTQFINRGNNVQIVVMQGVIGTNNWQLIQNVVIPKSLSPIAPSTIYMHGYGVIR